MAQGRWAYTKGLHELGNGCYAYLQPDGSWGWSNAGLVSDSGQALLVDTLFDLKLTREMLAAMRAAEPKAAIATVVNTHSNADHVNGNQLLSGAEIITSRACAEEMGREAGAMLGELMKKAPAMGELGQFLLAHFGAFDFEGIERPSPTRTFDGTLSVAVGDKRVELIEVGPAHTAGDILAYVPADKTIFTGDILFIGGHPIMWAGPVENWINACQRILDLPVEIIVPGHGPITDKAGVAAVKGYLEYVREQSYQRFVAGVPAAEAAREIALDAYASWSDAERIIVNVMVLYNQFSGGKQRLDAMEALRLMAAMEQSR